MLSEIASIKYSNCLSSSKSRAEIGNINSIVVWIAKPLGGLNLRMSLIAHTNVEEDKEWEQGGIKRPKRQFNKS